MPRSSQARVAVARRLAESADGAAVCRELHVCEFCLYVCTSASDLATRYAPRCGSRAPPGEEVYRDDALGLSVFCVDPTAGRTQKHYCESVALLSRLFLAHLGAGVALALVVGVALWVAQDTEAARRETLKILDVVEEDIKEMSK